MYMQARPSRPTTWVVPQRAARSGPGLRRTASLLGPAFVAAIAYVDPGNFATNFAGGSAYGYRLLWVVVAANLVAMLIQGLSAKLGVVTGRNLPQLCRQRLPRPLTWGLWLQAEAVVMATDVAEVIGGAVALQLLFGLPLLTGGLVTAALACALLAVHRGSQVRFERAIALVLGLILLGFAFQLTRSGVNGAAAGRGLVPGLAGPGSLLMTSAMIGATVMPHAVYLHADLTKARYRRTAGGTARALRAVRADIVLALGVAGLANAAMLLVAAGLIAGSGMGAESIQGVHRALGTLAGPATALAFALALLASGWASSSVGTFAGQVVMDGFLRRRIPLVLRRVVGLLPALLLLGMGADPTHALVVSQVVLSLGVPFALVPLVAFTASARVMGVHRNRRSTTVAAGAAAALIIGLNVVLVLQVLR
jgi:manganese transport protein